MFILKYSQLYLLVVTFNDSIFILKYLYFLILTKHYCTNAALELRVFYFETAQYILCCAAH